MSSVSYCFNICRSVDKNITNQRRCSTSVTQPTENSSETGTLIFGRRFSFVPAPQLNTNHSSQNQNDSSSNQSSS